MTPELFSTVRRFLREDRGATAIEYAMIAAGIALAVSLIVFTIGTSLTTNFYGRVVNAF